MKGIMKGMVFGWLAVSVVMLGGCERMLEEEPRTILSPSGILNNPDGYEAVAKGMYASFPLYVMFSHELISDIYRAPDAGVEQALPIYNNNPTPSYYNARDAWNGPYGVIKNANFLLENLPSSPLADGKRNELTAEARLLRAYAFFDLVQLFGDVPMPTRVAPSYAELQLPRTPQREVYGLIVDDLLFAEANLPVDAPQQGRVYRAVATALLARVYLTMAGNPLRLTEYFVQARDKALAVIGDSRFALMPDYAAVFHNEAYTTESIWERQYVPGRGGNGMHGNMATATGYRPVLMPADAFINSFPAGDRRKAWGIQQHYAAPEGTLALPFFQKFVDTDLIDRQVGPSQAIVSWSRPIIRLAELYLIAAEAENEANGPANAYQYVNTLRRRARVDKGNTTHVPDLAALTKEQLREALLNERNWELHAEGQGWQTLKRTDTFQKIQAARGSSLNVPIGPYNQTWLIPTAEITTNNIPQNPLYQ